MATKSPISTLAELIGVRQQYLRSSHLEHHDAETAHLYIPTGRATEVLHRLTRAMNGESPGRAWSITGPYGAGKSSFALYLDALLGPEDDRAREAALISLASVDIDLAAGLAQGRDAIGAGPRGFIRASVTAAKEPLTATISRALRRGAQRWWKRIPSEVSSALTKLANEPSPSAAVEALTALTQHAPVLLMLDEFGKNLEHFATDAGSADLFLLQEIAERSTGERGLPVVTVTIQHMAFEDYVRGATVAQQREWGKVQGRFEDVPFVESAEQGVLFPSRVLDHSDAPAAFAKRTRSWAKANASRCDDLGLSRFLPGGETLLGNSYPLHPLTLIVLPQLAAQFGQHGRTLFAFLSHQVDHSVGSFLREVRVPSRGDLPSVHLDRLYDYFIDAGVASAPGGSRWREVETRIREASGLDEIQLTAAKTVGVLNLITQGGAIRASAQLIAFALDMDADEAAIVLQDLCDQGLLTYRAFADEYRLWQGSDLDPARLVTNAKEELVNQSSASVLQLHRKMTPVVAGRHSQHVGMLRFFEVAFADEHSDEVRPPGSRADPDGLLVYFIGDPKEVGNLQVAAGSKPVVVATTDRHREIREAVLEYAAVLHAMTPPDVRVDRVARRELEDRAVDARHRLEETLLATLHPNAEGVTIKLLQPKHDAPVKGNSGRVVKGARGLSSLLSTVCDRAYSESPTIRNEMIARRELTSQGAKARRELMSLMVSKGELDSLGIEGYGPEKAVYEAVLRHTGIHGPEEGSSEWGWSSPDPGSGLQHAWGAIGEILEESNEGPTPVDTIYSVLMAPPIGLTEGPIPILLTAFLLQRRDSVAVYQEGTYQPLLTADMLERMVKSPERFAIKEFHTIGSRASVLKQLGIALGVTPGNLPAKRQRNASLLSVVAPLVAAVGALPEYTLKTDSLSTDAAAVRDTILAARQPDDLLFNALPTALGMKPFKTKGAQSSDVEAFAELVSTALDQLRAAYAALLEDCVELLAGELSLTATLPEARLELAGRAVPLKGTLLEPKLRAFVHLASDHELDDESWLQAMLNSLVARPPVSWKTEDVRRFEIAVQDIAGIFGRVLALHYDALVHGEGGFDAHRVTVTSPNGTESSRVVWVDEKHRSALSDAAQKALTSARNLLGPQGGEALLAFLAGTVLDGEGVLDEAPSGINRPHTKKATHG